MGAWRAGNQTRSPLLWLLALLVFVAAALTAFQFLLVAGGTSLLADDGAYLLNRDAWLGVSHDTALQPRPPLAPGGMLVPFTSLLGNVAGMKAWGIVGFLFVLSATYYLSRGVFTPMMALATSALTSVSFWMIEGWIAAALVLYGWALVAVAFRPVVDWAMGVQSTWRIALMAASLGLLPFVNQTLAGLCVLLFAVGLPTALLVRRRDYGFRGSWWFLGGLLAGGSVAIFSLPYYLPVAPGGDVVSYGEQPIMIMLVDEVHPFVQATAASVLIATWVFWKPVKEGPAGLKVMYSGMVLCAALIPFESSDEAIWNLSYRANYLSAMFIPALMVQTGCRMGLGQKSFGVCFFGSLTFVIIFLVTVQNTVTKPDIHADAVLAYEWLSDNSAEHEAVVSRGWGAAKVAAVYTHKPTFAAIHFEGLGDAPPRYIERTAYAARCVLEPISSHCIYGTVAEEIERHNIRHAMVTRWQLLPNTDADAMWRRFDALPYTELVWQRGSVRIWELHSELAPD